MKILGLVDLRGGLGAGAVQAPLRERVATATARPVLGLYLLMGWTALAAIKPLYAALPRDGFLLLMAGGLAYTFGTVLYVLHRIPFTHFCWHLTGLSGSALHFFAVRLCVLTG